MSRQFASAQRRCRSCDFPAQVLAGSHNKTKYQCRACGTKFTHLRNKKLLSWVFKLTYYAICLRRILGTPRRSMALLAIRKVSEAGLREEIIRLAGLW